MDSYAANWLSDLENMEDCDYNMFGVMKCMEYDDDQFISHDIASVVQGKYNNLQPCLSCESVTKCMSNNSSITSESGFKSSNWNHTVSEHSSSQLLSFDNSNNNNSSPSSNQFYGFNNNNNNNNNNESALMSQIQSGDMNYCEKKGSEGGVKRGIPQVRDHIMAERKRREKLSQSFIALSALLPGLKKMDKASVLGDAIKYVKEMKEKLTMLEEQNKKRRVMESVVTVKKSPICGGDDDSSSSEENVINGVGEAESLPEVEVRVSDKDVLLRIHCQKHKGILVKILAEIQNLDLFVVNSSVLPFGDSNIDVTIIAQMGEGYNLRMKDLVKNLRVAILSVCEEMNVV